MFVKKLLDRFFIKPFGWAKKNSPEIIKARRKLVQQEKLGLFRYLFFPHYLTHHSAEELDDIQLIGIHYDQKTEDYIEKLNELKIPAPFLGVKYDIEPERCLTRYKTCYKNRKNEKIYFELQIYAYTYYEILYPDGYTYIIDIPETSKRYAILMHVQTDEVYTSQGLKIAHDASVLKFADGQLDTLCAYHKERGLKKLG